VRAEGELSEDQLQRARGDFAEGLRLEELRDFVGALERFERVASIKATPQVRFHRALCLEKLGRWTDAREEFVLARDSAAGDSEDLPLVRRNSASHILELDRRMPTVVLTLRPAGARVMLDARVLPSTLGSTPVPLDPGPHILRATATGYRELVERLDAKPQQRLRARVQLELIPKTNDQPLDTAGRAPLYLSSGIAAGSFVAAGVFYGLRASAMSQLDAQCGAGRRQCADEDRALDARGGTYTTLGNVFLGVGISATAVALGALIWGGSKGSSGPPTPRPSSLQISLMATPRAASM